RADRKWFTAWSPEQISHRLKIDFPDDESMRISHEAIYQSLYIEGRGALKRELVAALRTGRALRKPRARACPASSSWQVFFDFEVGDGGVGEPEVYLLGPVECDRFVRADGFVLDAVVHG